MTEELKSSRAELWAKALEENDGKEARGQFQKGSLRCCLRVAADVAIEELGVKSKDGIASQFVADFYGWESCNPLLGSVPATYHNDDEKAPHKDIAKLVRKEFCK